MVVQGRWSRGPYDRAMVDGAAHSGPAPAEGSRSIGVTLVRGPFVRLPRHPEAVDTEAELADLVGGWEGPLAADLFCGAGGLSLGLADAGYRVVIGVDHDENALETHRAYHPGLSVDRDLADAQTVEELGELIRDLGIDLVAGGPPCQPFSKAGRSLLRSLVRRGERPAHDDRRDLWQSFLRIVEIARPQAVLMENVPDMALDRDMWILRTMVDELEHMGYSVSERVVATRDYGVPQHRMRLILVALKGGAEFEWPAPTGELISVRAAIGDLPEVEGGWRPSNGDGEDPVASGWTEYLAPQVDYQKQMRKGMEGDLGSRVHDHITRPVRDDDARAFAGMDSKTKYSDIDPELRRYRSDIFDDKYKRLDWDELSRTITAHIAKDGYWYIHPSQDRTITVREAARIQTFGDRIRFAGPPSSAFRQIGNAVPPRLGEHLGLAVRRSIEVDRASPWSTATVSRTLAAWFDESGPVAMPWLAAENRWQVIQAEMLWSRLQRGHVAEAWRIVEKLRHPSATLDPNNRRALSLYAASVGRGDRVQRVVETAEWFLDRGEGSLTAGAQVDELRAAPEIGSAIADLAVRVCPSGEDDAEEPVLATGGVLRVVSRFFGEPDLETKNRNSDGRLAVARMIGGDECSHSAHLALMELAAGLCSTSGPDCGRCPLREHCAWAGTHAYQGALLSSSRER